MKLEGAVVAITGASAGIGHAAALAFARERARIAVCARREDRLQQLAREIEGLGAEVLVRAVDVADEAQVHGFVEAAVKRFGRLDVIVNNAGYGVRGRVDETPSADYRRLMEVNYLGTVYGCQAALNVMRAQGSGIVINVSSIVGHRAQPGGGAYAATKAAQVSLTEALRVELRGTGIAACSVHPIGTATEFAEVAARGSEGRQGGPTGPIQSAEAVAEAIVRCARHPRAEVYPYRLSRALVWINALWRRRGWRSDAPRRRRAHGAARAARGDPLGLPGFGLGLQLFPGGHEAGHFVQQALALGHGLVGGRAVVVEAGRRHQVLDVAHGALLLADVALEVAEPRLDLAHLALALLAVGRRARRPQPRRHGIDGPGSRQHGRGLRLRLLLVLDVDRCRTRVPWRSGRG